MQSSIGVGHIHVHHEPVLALHKEAQFKEILFSVTLTKNRIEINKWHQILGKLRSMEHTLPRDCVLFIQIQVSLNHIMANRLC